MDKKTPRMFTGCETALAYAISAEKICGNNADFLNANPPVVPIFVSLLFQSLEISIKRAGIDSRLFTIGQAKQCRHGHGIQELAALLDNRLGDNRFGAVIMAMTFASTHPNRKKIIKEMICGHRLQKTRESYAFRQLGYGEVAEGDFATIQPLSDWIKSVKETASNLPKIIETLSDWKILPIKPKHFTRWLIRRQGQ
jgi:hypothetical protein